MFYVIEMTVYKIHYVQPVTAAKWRIYMGNLKYDVVICGGGASGLPAALSAYRQGLKVAVIEEDFQIGGAAVDNSIQHFCGSPYQGIYKELHDTMISSSPEMKQFNCFRKAAYQIAWEQLFYNTNVDIFTGEIITEVNLEQGKILSVKTNNYIFEGIIFIDATGDGDVAYKSGCEMRYGREARSEFNEDFAPEESDNSVQMCTMMYSIKREPGNDSKHEVSWAKLNEDEFLIWGPTVNCANTTKSMEVQLSMKEAMRRMKDENEEWQKQGFFISEIAPRLGVRESRRLVGEYVLNLQDIMLRRKFQDSICAVQYPVDPWDPEGNPFHDKELIKKCETPYYEIPYRSLVTKKVLNLIVTGRCISATHVANSSCRVMGIAMMTGQAAGIAAKLAKDAECATFEIDTGKLVQILNQQGVSTSI